jgi:hypothetical protein
MENAARVPKSRVKQSEEEYSRVSRAINKALTSLPESQLVPSPNVSFELSPAPLCVSVFLCFCVFDTCACVNGSLCGLMCKFSLASLRETEKRIRTRIISRRTLV